MTHHDAFLQAIIENPSDDTPRLIYADFLEEHGQPDRAEFIRVQVELARHEVAVKSRGKGFPPPPMPEGFLASSRLKELRRREKELLDSHGFMWFRHTLSLVSPVWGVRNDTQRVGWKFSMRGRKEYEGPLQDCAFHRGFISSITLSCAAWIEHGDRLRKAAPLERVTLSDKTPNRTNIEARPSLPVWCWWKEGFGPLNAQLPFSLWCALQPPGEKYPIPWNRISVKDHLTEAAAIAALSAACLKATLPRR